MPPPELYQNYVIIQQLIFLDETSNNNSETEISMASVDLAMSVTPAELLYAPT